MRRYQQLGMRAVCVNIHKVRWFRQGEWDSECLLDLRQHCRNLGGKHTLVPLHVCALPWIHHSIRVQTWVRIVIELTKDWVTVAGCIVRGWGRDARLRRWRNLRLPLWYCSIRRVRAKTTVRRDALSVQRHTQWQRVDQCTLSHATWTWDHFIHLRQEAIKAGCCACWNRRRFFLRFVKRIVLVFWAGCSRVCFCVAFSLFFRQGIWFSLSLATEVTIIKHFLTVRVERPVVALSCTQILQMTKNITSYYSNTLLWFFCLNQIELTWKKTEEEILTWVIIIPWHLHEAIVKWKIVTNGVLPASLALVVEREVLRYVLIDLTERKPSVWGAVYCHGYQSWVRIWRSDKLHQVFLRRQREPAKGPFCAWHWSCPEIGSLHAVGLRPSSDVGRSIQPRVTEPQVRVGGRGGIFAQVTDRR